MLGAQSLKDLVPEMVCRHLLLWKYRNMKTESVSVMQVEKVDWYSAKL